MFLAWMLWIVNAATAGVHLACGDEGCHKKVHGTAESRHACRSLNDLFIYQPIDLPLVEVLDNKEPEFASSLHFSIREFSSPPTVVVLRKRVQKE